LPVLFLFRKLINDDRLRAVKGDEDSAPESISDTEHWLNWNGDLDVPNKSNDDCAVDVECEMERDNSIEDPQYPEQRDVSATPNVPGLIRPTPKSKGQAENVLLMVNTIKTRRNQGVNKK
jgi:hypothetical protein